MPLFVISAVPGDIATAIGQDLWPTAFHVRTGTTNRIDLAWARVFYG